MDDQRDYAEERDARTLWLDDLSEPVRLFIMDTAEALRRVDYTLRCAGVEWSERTDEIYTALQHLVEEGPDGI